MWPAGLTILSVTFAPFCVASVIKFFVLPQTASGGSSVWVFQVLLVAAFLGLNSGLSILNRWALGVHGLHLPLMMTALHMIFGTCALSPLMLLHRGYYDAHAATLGKVLKSVAILGVLNGLQVAANNASLTRIELSLNQVLRAFGPLCVAVIATCVEGKFTSAQETVWLLVIALGVSMTVYKEAQRDESSLVGAGLVLSSILMQSGILSVSSKLMGGVKLDGLQMAFYSGPFGAAILFPMALAAGEGAEIVRTLRAEPGVVTTFLLGSSILAVAYNVVVFQSSHTLSSVGTSVLANVKIVLLFALSALTLGEMANWGAREYAGCILTFGGSGAYSWLRMRKAEAAKQAQKVHQELEAEASAKLVTDAPPAAAAS